MHKCNECGHVGEARNHNGRGLRCVNCWSSDLTKVKPEPKPEPAKKPTTRRKRTPTTK